MKLTQQLHRYLPQLFVGLLFITAILSCQKELKFDSVPEKDHNLVLKFKPVATYDSVPLELGKAYTNYFKESYTPTAFKFYVHNIQMINTDSGKVFKLANDKYYLVDFSDSASTEIKIAISPYVYNRISFTIGVDSAQKCKRRSNRCTGPCQRHVLDLDYRLHYGQTGRYFAQIIPGR